MKKLIISVSVGLVAASLSFGAPWAGSVASPSTRGESAAGQTAGSGAFTGEIMDSACAAMGSHDQMMKKEGATSAKECSDKCVQGGSKYVLYDAATKTTYQLDDQKKATQFSGQKVTVAGNLDDATHTIHVSNIQASGS